jgi:hypothetical protein
MSVPVPSRLGRRQVEFLDHALGMNGHLEIVDGTIVFTEDQTADCEVSVIAELAYLLGSQIDIANQNADYAGDREARSAARVGVSLAVRLGLPACALRSDTWRQWVISGCPL